jgi:hypothetical protein
MRLRLNADNSADVFLSPEDVAKLSDGSLKITIFGGSKGITVSQNHRIRKSLVEDADDNELEMHIKNLMLRQAPLRARINNLVAHQEWGEGGYE